MVLRVIGAGLPRTGTTSLRAGLEHLLGGPCYHMSEFNEHFDRDESLWIRAYDGDSSAFAKLFGSYVAAVDWPTSLLWRELADCYPDALIVLSRRSTVAQWWTSLDATVWDSIRALTAQSTYYPITQTMFAKAGLSDDWDSPAAATALYHRVIDDVTAAIPEQRLLVWEPADGWAPLCAALDLAVPTVPFFHHNTTAEFRQRAASD